MKTVGIVVEYNPLHNGHQYHFSEAKKVTRSDAVIAVMSGNWLQRGEPAIVNKWARTRMALEMGVDLVIELPFTYSTQNAEMFAYGAVATLDATGIVDSLCFGSESGDLDWMMTLAETLSNEPENFQLALKKHLSQGLSYPHAYGQAIHATVAATRSLPHSVSQPNNILGLNYLMALFRLQSAIKPFTITRQKAGYHQQEISDQSIASATAIRKRIFEDQSLARLKPYVPLYTLQQLEREWAEGRAPNSFDSFGSPLFHMIHTQSVSQLSDIYECNEGLEYRLIQSVRKATSVEELIQLMKTKRYTWNRIQRLLVHILFRRTEADMKQLQPWKGPRYIRVLGFSTAGQKLLHQMTRSKAKVPVITNVKREPDSMLAWDIRAAQVYNLAFKDSADRQQYDEYRQAPIRI